MFFSCCKPHVEQFLLRTVHHVPSPIFSQTSSQGSGWAIRFLLPITKPCLCLPVALAVFDSLGWYIPLPHIHYLRLNVFGKCQVFPKNNPSRNTFDNNFKGVHPSLLFSFSVVHMKGVISTAFPPGGDSDGAVYWHIKGCFHLAPNPCKSLKEIFVECHCQKMPNCVYGGLQNRSTRGNGCKLGTTLSLT